MVDASHDGILLEETRVAIEVSSPTAQLTRDAVDLLGIPVDRIDMRELDTWIEAFIASGEPHQIITANLDFIAIKRRRPSFAQVIEDADLVLCDGKPLQWAAQLQGHAIPARITGVDLVLRTARLSAQHGHRLFLLGAAPGVAERAGNALEQMFPGVVIAGTYCPPDGPFDDAENARIVAAIHAARPDVLFVALGAPRQDEWIAAHAAEAGVPLAAGIGGVFNMLAGVTRRAPRWMQEAGLEWVFRLAQEPGRLWRRYLVNDLPIFARLIVAQVKRRAVMAGARASVASTTHPAGVSAAGLRPVIQTSAEIDGAKGPAS